jgi:hypothetical protein
LTIAEVLEATADQQLGESISSVITALKGQSLVVPLGREPDETGALAMMFANDNQGRAWLYVYSSEQELENANINAPAFRWVAFDQIVQATNAPNNGGIFIDAHKARGSYLIPSDYFSDIVAYLAQ